jgi:uncharacterized protein (TIGR02271 family)
VVGDKKGEPGLSGETVLRSSDVPTTEEAFDEVAREVADEAVLRLLVEELSIDRRKIETGRLRVRRVTHERVEDVEMDLERVEAEFERIPVGAIVEERPQVRETEDAIVIPVVEEIVVVERRLLLKEEIHVRKKRKVERIREQVTLRAQEAEIVRVPPRVPSVE